MRSVIDTRLHAGRRVYNAGLGEAFRWSRALRSDPRFEKARAKPKGKVGGQSFQELADQAGRSERALMSFGSSPRKSWVRDQVLSQETQTLARRAFRAAQRWHFGRSGKPRFKSARRGVHALECKDANGSRWVKETDGALVGLPWGDGPTVPSAKPKSLVQPAELDRITGLGAAGKVTSCWITRAQLVIDGAPPVRHPVGSARVSIDVGPSTAHVVSETAVAHFHLAPGVAYPTKAVRRAQRKLDRQHRKGSPSCFDDQHSHPEGGCDRHRRSRSARCSQAKVAELLRALAAHRDTEQGQLANQLSALGPHRRAEKLNYIAWQKRFPRSVRDLFSAFLGLYVEPREGSDTLDAELANGAFPTRHDLAGGPASRNAAGAPKQRVHQRRPSGRRLVVRIAKRLHRRSHGAARPSSVYPQLMALAA